MPGSRTSLDARLLAVCVLVATGVTFASGQTPVLPSGDIPPAKLSPPVLEFSDEDKLPTLPALVITEKKGPAPEPAAADDAAAEDTAACPASVCGFDWSKSKYRYQRTFWPIGNPANLPTGPGYYSLADALHGNYREKPPPAGYPRFFANPVALADYSFAYVDKKDYEPALWERWHRVHLGDSWMFGTGGEYRNRYTAEGNSRLTGLRNDFDLNRIQVFAELWYEDIFRVHIDYLDALITGNELPAIPPDRNYGEILNLFVDVKTAMIGDEALYTRLGRQQITLGSQRLISVLDWTNAMRTFDGVRAYRRSEKFDIDLFWLRPVIPHPTQLDSMDDQQNFVGAWTTYRPKKDQLLDTYWLYFNNNNDPVAARARGVGALVGPPHHVHTLGFRYAGRAENGFLWDLENMLQLGGFNRGPDICAGNTTTGLGYHWPDLPMNPTLWAYYDYATGSNSIAGSNTFNQLYPLAHYYMGWMDYVGRANIQDVNFHAYLYPTKWITFNAQYHILRLANARDGLYSVGGVVQRASPTGAAGTDVGSELDIIVNWHINAQTDIITAYGHFFAGDFLRATGPTNNLNTFWLIYNLRW